MLNDNAKKWIAALRSKDFAQGREVLHNEATDTYCCLGVLCEVYQREVGGLQLQTVSGQSLELKRMFPVTAYNTNAFFLPGCVQEWVGLATPHGDYYTGPHGTGLQSLSEDNDIHGLNFYEIADTIESEPPGLFRLGEPHQRRTDPAVATLS